LRTLSLHTMMTRLAFIGLLAAALGLAACGRKGPLDPPPSAQAPAPAGSPAAGQAAQSNDPSFDAAGNPVAGRADRKNFPLDGLLN